MARNSTECRRVPILLAVLRYEVTGPGRLRATESYFGFGLAFMFAAFGLCFVPVGGISFEALFILGLVGLAETRERIWVAAGRVQHEISLFGVTLSAHSTDAPAIEYVRLQTTQAGGVGLVTDAGTRTVGRSLDEAGAPWLRAWVGARV